MVKMGLVPPVTVDHLVGRIDEMRLLEQLLEECRGDHPNIVSVAGGSGIGKTRLLRELSTLAERRGYLVLEGSASEMERELPLSVFVDALDEYLEGLEPHRLDGLEESIERIKRRLRLSEPGEPS